LHRFNASKEELSESEVELLSGCRDVCEDETDEVDAAAVAESPITPTQAGTQSAALPRRRTARFARTAIQKARGPLSTKPQDLQVTFRRVISQDSELSIDRRCRHCCCECRSFYPRRISYVPYTPASSDKQAYSR